MEPEEHKRSKEKTVPIPIKDSDQKEGKNTRDLSGETHKQALDLLRKGSITGDMNMNMESSISLDDIQHAGGLGATDDLNSLLPSAIDSTDREESLIHARLFEANHEQEKKKQRHGLGWQQAFDPNPSFRN